MSRFLIFAAPLQGLTECPWRHYHHQFFSQGIDAYFTPFIRMDHGEVRRRDMRDIISPLNAGVPVVPQIIFRNLEEFRFLCDAVRDAGFSSVDINMGCPFPPQVRHGRGAGMMTNPPLLEALAEEMTGRYGGMAFSLKMRLGIESPSEWRDCARVVDALPLTHLTVHPRTVRQQYGGEVNMEEFAALLQTVSHPVIYNGDILAPAGIDRLRAAYPALSGVMIGRGLFSRPSLAEEWAEGREWSGAERLERMLGLHDAVYSYYLRHTEGDAQLIGKVKPFWVYLQDADRRTLKLLKKATTLPKYNAAVEALRHSIPS